MMRRFCIAGLLAVLAGSLLGGMALAQSALLTLNLSRDWGYGGFNGDIQGLFSMHVTGPTDLARVEFFIDVAKIGDLSQAPFNLQFNTGDFPLGVHKLSAIGYTSSGVEYTSNEISVNFVPAQSTWKFIAPVLVVVVLAVLLAAGIPLLGRRGKRTSIPLGAERDYGPNGGAICPRCHRPFVLPLLGMHVGFSKIAACPHCGKWSLVGRESLEKLRQAEKDELAMAQSEGTIPGKVQEDREHKDLDDSKYQD